MFPGLGVLALAGLWITAYPGGPVEGQLDARGEGGVHGEERAPVGPERGAPDRGGAMPEDFTLENGLRVLVLPDSSVPVVSVELWYDVGSGDEEEGEYGFAHLFEHLLQGPTAELAAGEGRRRILEAGGETSVSSDPDRTAFSTRVAAHHLELVLWIEAQRMGALRLDAAALDAARSTVAAEWRAVQAERDPLQRLRAFSWMLRPDAMDRPPPMGDPEEVERWALEDVRRFRSRFYGPGNATLAVVGETDAGAVRTWVQRHFGGIPAGEARPSRSRDTEVPRGRHRDLTADSAGAASVGEPVALLHAWHLPPADHPDMPALALLAELLQPGPEGLQGETAGTAAGVGPALSVELQSGLGTGLLVGLFPVRGSLGGGALRAALDAATSGVTSGEPVPGRVAAARGRLRARLVDGSATGLGRARLLQEGRRLYGDPARRDALQEALSAVTARDVATVARRYLVWENSSTLVVNGSRGGRE